MIGGNKERDAIWQALNLGFYALVEHLERAKVIDADTLADELARYDPGDDKFLRANLEGFKATLRSRPFAIRGPTLGVIDGGKED